MKVVSSSIVDVRLKNDKDLPLISGCVFLSTGQLVLCDCYNNKIMLLSSDLKVKESLDLQERKPCDISAASSSAVVITLPKERQLQFIQLSPELGHGQLIQLDKECWGVCVVGEEIYVTCRSSDIRDSGLSFYFRLAGDSGGEVRIYNTEGVVKRRLGAPPEPGSSYMFSLPQYLTVNACSGRIYVSDFDRHTLTCLSEDGSIIYQHRDPELSFPLGIYVDADDYVIVCDFYSSNLLMISPSGEKVSTLLSEKDGIMEPQSVAYRPTDGVLVIGCGEDNNIHVFKLSH